ncbi:hypothetical protein V6M85_07295 [Sulfolobus tengchongensis]|uniref:DUF2809 domain-containing protein n=1 Tax=Sulfolobus tengchongensis TaxID=207809 RepID=A0AAX4KZ57_9CREN
MINKKGIIIMTVFSIIYAILELGMRWDPSSMSNAPAWMKSVFTQTVSLYFYRILYILIFSFPSYLASSKLISIDTIWYLIYGSVAEDAIYWILDLRIPYSWAWFYPVYYGIPIDDVIGLVALFIIIKYKELRRKIWR